MSLFVCSHGATESAATPAITVIPSDIRRIWCSFSEMRLSAVLGEACPPPFLTSSFCTNLGFDQGAEALKRVL